MRCHSCQQEHGTLIQGMFCDDCHVDCGCPATSTPRVQGLCQKAASSELDRKKVAVDSQESLEADLPINPLRKRQPSFTALLGYYFWPASTT